MSARDALSPEKIERAKYLVRIEGLTFDEAAKELRIHPDELKRHVRVVPEPLTAKQVKALRRNCAGFTDSALDREDHAA